MIDFPGRIRKTGTILKKTLFFNIATIEKNNYENFSYSEFCLFLNPIFSCQFRGCGVCKSARAEEGCKMGFMKAS